MNEDSTSSSEFSESSDTTDLDTTFAESDRSNDLCTPEKLANCSILGIMCSGYIFRDDDTIKNARTDTVSVDDEDNIFFENLKSKIQKDLAKEREEENTKSSPMFPGLNYKKKRKHPFDDHSENLMRKFKESLIKENSLESQNNSTLTPTLPSYNTINHSNHVINNNDGRSGITKPLENREKKTTTRESEGNINNIFCTPKNVFRINNIAGNTSSTFSLEVTSTISRKRRSAANNTTVLETKTKKVVYCAKFQPS